MQKIMKRLVPSLMAISLVMVAFGLQVSTATAAALTSLSDNMSRLQTGVASNHTIQFVTPTGVAAGQNITITFSADFTGVSGIDDGDVDMATAATCSGFSDKTLAAAPSGATWGVTSSGQVVTILSGTDTITATHCVQIEIGTNATSGGTGNEQVTNGAADDNDTIAIAGTFTDTGTISVDITDDDQVDITATVSPSIAFDVVGNTIEFGTLTSADDTFADASGGNATETEAHTITAGTNATSGYVLYVSGATLTSGGDTITAIGSSNTASSAGSEQFGVRYVASGGSGTVSVPYAAAGFAYDGITTPDEIASVGGPSATTTYSARYVANITATTEAGSYSTTLTYTGTATY